MKVGVWTFRLHQTTDLNPQSIDLVVTSFSDVTEEALNIKTSIKPTEDGNCLLLNADVTQDTHAVIGLNIEARISTSQMEKQVVHLEDNGAGNSSKIS